MATNVKVIKNTFNKNQHKKYALVMDLLGLCRLVSYPNGNSGYEDRDVFVLFCNTDIWGEGPLNGLLVKVTHGDPHTCNKMVIDPSLLSPEHEKVIQYLLEKTPCNRAKTGSMSRFGQHVRGIAPAQGLKWLGA